MNEYGAEEEQAEILKKWWEENGKFVTAGIAVGLIAIFGWRSYSRNLELQTQKASTIYEQMIIAAQNNDTEDSRVYIDHIITEHGSSIYAIFARLMLAKIAVEDKQLDQAETHLRWVLDHNDQPEIRHITNLRLARVYIAAGKLDQANKLLNTSAPGKFIATYEELRGDLLVKQGKASEARTAYQNALFNTVAAEKNRFILEMKLDDLGGG